MSRESWDRLKLTYWGERGFARAMALCTGGKSPSDYPTQDKHTPEDEKEFVEGYNLAMAMFKAEGFKVFEAYKTEDDEAKE